MNIEEIKKLVNLFHQVSYKDLFGALMVYERIDYLGELEDITNNDLDYLEELYDYYMKSDIRLINSDEIVEDFEENKKINID